MKLRTAAAVAMLGGVMAVAPALVEAGDRDNRSGRHGYSSHRNSSYRNGYSSYRSHDNRRSRDYRRSYDYRRSGRDYRYRYVVPPRSYGYVYAPYDDYYYSPRYDYYDYDYGYRPRYSRSRGHYHGRSFCLRPHISLHIGF
jgi:hypothetical protein